MDQKNAAPGHIGKLFLREDSKPFKETAFARIYKCSKRDGTIIVEKCVRKSAYKNIENEVESFKRITRGAHPPDNVIQYYDSDKPDEDGDISFYMELCDGTIDEYWSMEDGSKKYRTTLLELCEQAATGIYNLHMECNMIHRDIKPKNFLIREDGCDLVVKVSDFGLSKVLDLCQSSAPTTSHSTVTYMAPEHHPVDNQNSTSWKKSADIFSLGVLFFNIFTCGKHPFGKTFAKQLFNIEDEKPPSFEVFLECSGFPTEENKVLAFILIKSMLQVDPTKRPSIEEVFNHPLFWNSDEKINFYWTADDFLRDKRKKSKTFETTVKFFDSALVTFDVDDKEKKEFEIKLENVPTPLKKEKKKFSISKCEDIFDLVKIIRDMDAHINEKKKNSKEVLGYSGIGDRNYDTFLDSLVGSYPHLLAHLFELLKHNNIKLPSRVCKKVSREEVGTVFRKNSSPVEESKNCADVEAVVPVEPVGNLVGAGLVKKSWKSVQKYERRMWRLCYDLAKEFAQSDIKHFFRKLSKARNLENKIEEIEYGAENKSFKENFVQFFRELMKEGNELFNPQSIYDLFEEKDWVSYKQTVLEHFPEVVLNQSFVGDVVQDQLPPPRPSIANLRSQADIFSKDKDYEGKMYKMGVDWADEVDKKDIFWIFRQLTILDNPEMKIDNVDTTDSSIEQFMYFYQILLKHGKEFNPQHIVDVCCYEGWNSYAYLVKRHFPQVQLPNSSH